MARVFDVFSMHDRVMHEYRDYVRSHVSIRADEIRGVVEEEIENGFYWPDPLLQFNPAFASGGSIEKLCDRGLLHQEIRNIFPEFQLFHHQVEALKLGCEGKDFVVTSGTGSGKSLTYLGSIFDHVLKQDIDGGIHGGRGIRAVIVYPMNALINSQKKALDDFAEEYRETTGREFPISYARYTGQESQPDRDAIKEGLPHILLTNYMMLELILTRHHEERLKLSMYRSLRFLVFDELHTYRGRQGADVAMLIRRIRAAVEHNVVCIGTSATMVSGGDDSNQKAQVSAVASKIFGKPFKPGQIIGETLAYSFLAPGSEEPDKASLREAVLESIDLQAPEETLVHHPISIWIDRSIALTTADGHADRKRPMTISEIAELLSAESGVDTVTCRSQLERFLLWVAEVNALLAEEDSKSPKKRSGYLPYKIHQFISQTGAVYVTLGVRDERKITLEPALETEIGGNYVPLYPAVFSRLSGAEFICVRIDEAEGKFVPRGFDDTVDLENNEDDDTADFRSMGYLIPDRDEWSPEDDLYKLPETWFRKDRNGDLRLKNGLPVPIKRYEGRLPQEVSYDTKGFYSRDPGNLPMRGWYMPALLLFDPTSGRIYGGNAREPGKLSRLGSEGRCSATTMLSIAILREMGDTGFQREDQKLLSFTDNRQDAAFQAGHFNDFLRVIELRSALYHALSERGLLDYQTVNQAVYDHLNLEPLEYARHPPGEFAAAQRRIAETFRKFIMYRLLFDLRGEWRVTVPNLESTALLRISYRDLEENCASASGWANAGFLADCSFEERLEIIYQILDCFRKSYAISSKNYLTEDALSGNQLEIREMLKAPWTLDVEEDLSPPKVLRLRPLSRKAPFEGESAGYQSLLGRYLRNVSADHGQRISKSDYDEFAEKIFSTLMGAKWLVGIDTKDAAGADMQAYRLSLDSIIWTPGDGEHVPSDPIRARSFRSIESKPNSYFQRLYRTDYRRAKRLLSGEHTGQIMNQDREVREKQFGKGELSALFCSPTMELGIDIKELNIVHLRNVPPNPANYAQRSGRAGRGGQPALIYTLCSSYAPHDRHYFRNSRDMVSGVVHAPKLDLGNRELLESHLHALYLSRKPIAALSNSMQDILEMEVADYPLSDDAKRAITMETPEATELCRHFLSAVSDVAETDLARTDFFSERWVEDTIGHVGGEAGTFNRSIDRWRQMYALVQSQINEATDKIKAGTYRAASRESRELDIQLKRALRQRALLLNDLGFSSFSEFYPYRYFAAEGFLPGYNFTRLPIRAFIPSGNDGEYISRGRFLALTEFGPKNILYHNGEKYQIDQVAMSDIADHLGEAKIAKDTGYLLTGDEIKKSSSPFNGAELAGNVAPIIPFLDMPDVKAVRRDRISCDEEVRTTYGYATESYFRVDGDIERMKTARLFNDGNEFLRIRYIRACRLYRLNKRWKTSKETGFVLGMSSGRWKSRAAVEKNTQDSGNTPGSEDLKSVLLLTSDTADALYIEPVERLGLEQEGVVTLQYALKRAVERLYDAEEREVGTVLLGNAPNILLYEAAEGSLGVLSRLVAEPEAFIEVIEEARSLCRFDDESYTDKASYDDLLSYFNQIDHQHIDRYLIKKALRELAECSVDTGAGGDKTDDYDRHYVSIMGRIDTSSTLERKLIEYLFARGLRLPDAAQRSVPDVYCTPDFFYEPDFYVFVDGPSHDVSEVAEHDETIREAIFNAGYEYVVYSYDDDLDAFVARRPDIFAKVHR